MLQTTDLMPLQRKALLAAIQSPTNTLSRSRKAYVPQGAADPHPPAFTVRIVNALERDGLVTFDPPQFPSRVTLTDEGVRLAEQLLATGHAAAVVA